MLSYSQLQKEVEMHGLGKILTLVFLLLFLAGCGSGGEEPDGVEIEIDCSSPVFTRTEPLPPGTHPERWITAGDSYWACAGSEEYYHHADGTITGRLDTGTEEYGLLLAFWRTCRVGTQPPEVAGNWVVANNTLCTRFDITPGIIGCVDIISEPAGTSATIGGDTETIQYGQVIDSSYEEADTCYLEEE